MKPEPVTKTTFLNRSNYLYKPLTRFVIQLVFSICVLMTVTVLNAQSYGLQFASRDADPEKRTSLDLTPDESLCASQKVELSFELTFVPNNPDYFGYVFRVINDQKQNLDMLYNQTTTSFKIVFGNSYTDIGFSIDPAD